MEALSRPADFFTVAAVPGRSAALDVCVASSNAAAARGDAAHEAFACNFWLTLDILHRPELVWTPEGRPPPCRHV